MYAADRAAMALGVSGLELMENAGAGAAREILERFGARPAAVLCGPGNNGGDGFVIARHLAAAGAPVRLALLGARERLKGDAAAMAGRWAGPVEPLGEAALEGAGLVVDALFGAGLARPLEGPARAVLEAAAAGGLPLVAVDVPSGLDGDTGQPLGYAPQAAMTVTFFRPKPGHLLHPGRRLAGELRTVDIGIPEAVLAALAPRTVRNHPDLWRARFPWPDAEGHKYSRGHAVVLAGGRGRSGAARLAARAALRAGAGLVTLAAPPAAMAECAAQLTAVMLAEARGPEGFRRAIADRRRNAVLLGPGGGVGAALRQDVLAALALGKRLVLDADAITSFAAGPEALFGAVGGAEVLLTPHEGEFGRLFPDLAGGKLQRARAAAARSGATVLLKGPDTVIAAPDGRAAIALDGPPELATAGSGDVLAGLCLGLLAQGLDAYEAGRIGAWLHAMAGRAAGPGLIAEDLSEALPGVLRGLKDGA